MTSTILSPTGRQMRLQATLTTTPQSDTDAKAVRIRQSKASKLAENRAHFSDRNVQAFLKAIADAEGGGYDFKYGAVKGKRNDPWRFSDFSTHPGAGVDRRTTAAGM